MVFFIRPFLALPRENNYPGIPRVAQLWEDGYSSGEDSYTANSIVTAFSYEGSIPPIPQSSHTSESTHKTVNKEKQGSTPTILNQVLTNEQGSNWADRIREYSQPSMQNRPHSPSSSSYQSDLISDKASSRAEVAELKTKMSELTTSFEVQRTELIAFFKEEMPKSLSE